MPRGGGRRVERITLPAAWPEVVAYRCGRRLSEAGADEVPGMIRQGYGIDAWLEPPEVEAHLLLGDEPFERWLRLGWTHQVSDEEGR